MWRVIKASIIEMMTMVLCHPSQYGRAKVLGRIEGFDQAVTDT